MFFSNKICDKILTKVGRNSPVAQISATNGQAESPLSEETLDTPFLCLHNEQRGPGEAPGHSTTLVQQELSVGQIARSRSQTRTKDTYFTKDADGKRTYFELIVDTFPHPHEEEDLTAVYFHNVTSQVEIADVQRLVAVKEEQNEQLKGYQAML